MRDGDIIWDSGKVASSSMTHIRYNGKELHSRDRAFWTVVLWDEHDAAGSEAESWFEIGLASPDEWSARMIGGDYKPRKKQRYPVDCFRKKFAVLKKPVRARLYATAQGLYDVTFNEKRLEDFILAPGMTDYRRRIQYQTYDMTGLIEQDNTIELRLADGWFRGSVAAYGVTDVFGTQTGVMAQLEVQFEDGSVQKVVTDGSWEWSNDGPIRFADLKDGEYYNAAKLPSYQGKAKEISLPKGVLITASDNVPVTEHERFKPVMLKAADGTRVLDFGQNIAGYPEFWVKGKTGQKFRLICGEVLDKEGKVDLSGIQESRPAKGWNSLSLVKKLLTNKVSGEADFTPHQEIRFICSGETDHYKTRFAIFGFRYIQIEGNIPVNPEDFTAIAVYSDLEQTGTFSCSNELVNRFLENTRWSMKGNFLDVPTDCPTRERLGWTGDAQVFFDTGAYLMNTAPFFRKWMRDMADDVYPNGLISAVVPYSGVEMMYKATGSSVGWADAIYLVPWRYYLRYGDRQMLEESWPMIEKYARYLLGNLGMRDKKEAKNNPDNAYTYEKGVHLGEWLEPEEFKDQVYGTKAKHPEECTAYLYYSMTVIAKIAGMLDKPYNDYEACAAGAKRAYRRFAELDTNRQAKLVRPLALGLFDDDKELEARARTQLKKAVEDYRYRVGTGFLSTPFILPVLTQAGESETAYKMLENTERPGWLAEVLDGATTVWENWEGNLSQNHYSPGAVCQWLFDTVAGIRADGENHFVIAPIPGGTLTYAEAQYLSPYGEVKSSWKREQGETVYSIEIPANCSAEIKLPDRESREVGAGEYIIRI
ncbi:MAG: family 78 glycoside hydrolase catalytic domain [Blautia sp.]|nr:family 78 glycoside hydrolase catalytic domain [Blautia sp.]